MDIIGIDIGTVSIKYIRIQRKAKKTNIVSKNCFDYKGTIEDLEDIIGRIAENEGTGHEIALGITSQEIFKKSFTIPIMPKEEIKEAVTWSASKAISVPIEDTYYEFDIIGDVDERGIKKRDIFLAGVEKGYANKIIDIFKNKGFKKITLFTDTSFVYAQYLKTLSPDLSVVIDIGGRITGIYIVENGKNLFFREILTASESFTDALMSGLKYTYGEAENYKKEQGFTEDSDPVLSTTLERLVGEIQRTFNVFAQKYPEKIVKKVYLTGRGSKIPNLLERLKGFLTEEIFYLPLEEDMEEIFLPAYILSINKSQLFNLLPEEMKLQEKEDSQKKWIRVGTIGIMSILTILTINTVSSLIKLDSAIDINKMLISKKKQELAQISGATSTVTFEEYATLLSETKKRDLTCISLLKHLSSKLPVNISLKAVYLETSDKAQDIQKKEQAKIQQEAIQTPQKRELKSTSEGPYVVKIKGYIFGEKNLLEPALLELIIKLEESGFIYKIDISGKDMKTIKGRGVMEFELKGWCAIHEV